MKTRLQEWLDSQGNKIDTTPANNTQKTSGYPDQTPIYKDIISQIKKDGAGSFTINLLTDRILAFSIDINNKIPQTIGIKIIFKPWVPCYLMQINLKTMTKESNCSSIKEVLICLAALNIINPSRVFNQTIQENTIAKEFSIYENMWN